MTSGFLHQFDKKGYHTTTNFESFLAIFHFKQMYR